MTDKDVAAYLAAAAWADGPMTEVERGLVENLLFSLGLERADAQELLKGWEFQAPEPPSITSLVERSQGIALLRALLVLSYSDGHFGIEELPYLTKVLDKFRVPTEELVQLRLQARYYLDPEALDIELDPVLPQSGDWPAVEAAARAERSLLRVEAEGKIREELNSAQEDSLFLILYRGRSFNPKEAREEFAKRREALTERHGPMGDRELLQAQITLVTLAKWDRLYAERCASCSLAAPGLKGTLCPRCNEDYL